MYIRAETPADYAAIAELHILAFGNQTDEAVIVALLRQRHSYDPELSLVAEIEGQVVGHAIFTPCTIMLNAKATDVVHDRTQKLLSLSESAIERDKYLIKKEVQVVLLAPIGVHPDFQKQGIGGELIEAGHDMARKKGYPLSFLIGHSSYYPRFGYQTWAFGGSSLEVDTSTLSDCDLDVRSPLADDIPALQALWMHEEGNINYALQNDTHLIDWLSPNPTMKALVYLQGDELVGYSRGNAKDVRLFLAKNHAVAKMMAKHIAGDNETIKLPLHPNSASIGAFGQADYRAWEAAMVCPLVDNAPLPKADSLVGRPIWSSAFDLA